jgi:predicted permease
VVLILALGMGANTAVFSALDILAFRGLPVRNPEQLVLVRIVHPQGPNGATSSNYVSTAAYENLRDHAHTLSGVATLNGSGGNRSLIATGLGRTESIRVHTSDVSGNYFSVLQVRPQIGRLLLPEDDRTDAPHLVAVLSHAFWEREFARDPAVVGKSVTIENVSFEIIGVTEPGFSGLQIGEPIHVWTPLQTLPLTNPRLGANLRSPTRSWNGLLAIGRLRPGVPLEKASAEVNVVYQNGAADLRPDDSPAERLRNFGRMELEPGSRGFPSDTQAKLTPALRILLFVVVLVQLIACANVAGLSLARLAARQREFAARTALGAGRGRLIRQLLTESLLLVAGGALLGLLFVYWGFVATRAQGLDARPSGPILLFALVLAVGTGILVALIPALNSSRVDLASALKYQSNAVASGGRGRLHPVLVVLQLAISGCLLAGTGYFVRTVQNLQLIDLGFPRENLLMVGVDTPRNYDGKRRTDFARELLEVVGAQPRVKHVTFASTGLLGGGTAQGNITVEGYVPQRDEDMTARFVFAGPDFFATLGLPLLRGRDLAVDDVFPASRTTVQKAVVGAAMARRFFGDLNPIGRQLKWGRAEYEIIGVAKDTKYRSLREENPLVCYIPEPNFAMPVIGLKIRTSESPGALASSIGAVVKQIDPNARVLAPQTIDDVIWRATTEERRVAWGIGAFSILALLLTCLGLYGMLAGNVVQRTKEIGVRMALGGRPVDIVLMIIRRGLVLTGIGCAVGIAAAMALVRVIAARLYGVDAADPITLGGTVVFLAAVAFLASWLPARRATKIDPIIALRAE